jgi:Tn7-like transposition protein D/TniQ
MTDQRDLFDLWVPTWIPHETLFGLCSRYHRISGHGTASATSRRLFGHPRVGTSHDLPGRIDQFVERSSGRLGDPESILRHRTVLGFYLQFLCEERAQQAMSQLTIQGPASLKAQLGWLASRFGTNHPLKACSACMTSDSLRSHICTWHLVHQLPGVWICPTHRLPLVTATVKTYGARRFQWFLPDDDIFRDDGPPWLNERGSPQQRTLEEFANAAESAIATSGAFKLDIDRFSQTCKAHLIERGFARESGRWYARDIGDSLSRFLNELRFLSPGCPVSHEPMAAIDSLRRLIVHKAGAHPLRYISTAIWLFGGWAPFLLAYKDHGGESERQLPLSQQAAQENGSPTNSAGAKQKHFLWLVTDGGKAVTTAARVAGVDAQTGLKWASRLGICVRRRPKLVSPRMRRQIIKELAVGQSVRHISAAHQVSGQTINRILKSEPNLDIERSRQLALARQLEARKRWEQVGQRCGSAGIKAMRTLEPATFAWLYRHDREWLSEQSSRLTPAKRSNHTTIDWSARDLRFAQAIRNVLTLPHIGEASTTCARRMLLLSITGLPQKIRHLDRLPLTRVAIEDAMTRFESDKQVPQRSIALSQVA